MQYGMQIALTGILMVLAVTVAVHFIGKCPKAYLAVPLLVAYFSGWAAVFLGLLVSAWA